MMLSKDSSWLLPISGVHLPDHDEAVLDWQEAAVRTHQGAEENTRQYEDLYIYFIILSTFLQNN